MRIFRLFGLLLLFSPLVAVAAESVTWTMNHVPHGVTAVDLGATLTGVSGVQVRVMGYGGYDLVRCPTDVDSTGVRLPLTLMIDLVGGARWTQEIPLSEDFDVVGDFLLWGPDPGWEFIQDGRFDLLLVDHTFDYDLLNCWVDDADSEDSVIGELTLIIWCESALPAQAATWDGIKAIFR